LQHIHLPSAEGGYCEHCGQRTAPSYGSRTGASNRVGIAISILLHLLALGFYLMRDTAPDRKAPPPDSGAMVYIAPMHDQPAPSQPKPVQVAKAEAKAEPKVKPKVKPPRPPAASKKKRAETAPDKPAVTAQFVPPAVSPMANPPPLEDMESRIAARRKQRAQASHSDSEPAEESENDRGMRIARANIASAQGSSSGSDRNESGGVFSVLNQTFHGADVKFRGWNTNFKRNWSQQVRVEQGTERDIETAIVKTMIELIRKEKPGDFVWDSHRLGRNVNLSARVPDTAELERFLLEEFFPDYRAQAR
jgi:type IV secretory pathway VirB10-like protein